MTNENEQGFAISYPDGLWAAGTVNAGGKWRLVLGVKEERVIYPTDCTFLLRFPDADEKALAEKWAERMGYPSLTAYILEAIVAYNQKWREHAGYEERRAEEAA